MLARSRTAAAGHGFRFRNALYSLDATTIDLCLSVFPRARFPRAEGTVKLHVGLDHTGLLPAFARSRLRHRWHNAAHRHCESVYAILLTRPASGRAPRIGAYFFRRA